MFEACVLSKLLLHTAWLNVSDTRKLNAFQAQCCRVIAGIPHSYISRVSNATVLERCNQQKLSHTLHHRKLTPMHKIALLPDDDVNGRIVFQPSSFELLHQQPPVREEVQETAGQIKFSVWHYRLRAARPIYMHSGTSHHTCGRIMPSYSASGCLKQCHLC